MKIMKKISVFVFAMVMFVSMIGGANAYTQNVTIEKTNIDIAFVQDNNPYKPYVALKGSLKNDAAKVYVQEIQIDQTTYRAINSNIEAKQNYYEQNKNILDNGTAEQKAPVEAKLEEYAATEKNLIPSFSDSNWKELTKTGSTTDENQYGATVSGDNAFYVVWVKVSLNGTDSYAYMQGCLDEPETTVVCKIQDGKYYGKDGSEVTKEQYSEQCEKKVCRIEGGKYYDKDGKEVSKTDYYKACPNPKTGNNTYYTYGIITVIGACVLYMFTKRIKKFSK